MQQVQSQEIAFQSQKWLKVAFLSVAVTTALAFTGCASKPQINNTVRYANAPDYYTVRSGDTLSGIAQRYGLSYISVAQMNDIAPPYTIYVNQSLRLKSSGKKTTTTQSYADSTPIQRQSIALPNQTQAYTPPVQNTVPQNTAPNVTVAPTPTSLKWVRPSSNAIIARYNAASNIKGVRFGGNLGDPIYSAADGQVVYAADGLKEYGNVVLVKHIDGYITAYAHNSKMLVKSGDNVKAGQKIAEIGSTGASQNMLEFQIRLNGKPIDPATILPLN